MLNTAVLCCGEPGSVKRSSPVVAAVSRLKDITGTQSSDTERCHGGGGSGRPVNHPPAAAAATVTAAHRRPTVRRRPSSASLRPLLSWNDPHQQHSHGLQCQPDLTESLTVVSIGSLRCRHY